MKRLALLRVNEAGASAVEFAILAPLVFAIVFGTLTGGMAWNSKQALNHAAREAARFAATLPLTDLTEQEWTQRVANRAEEAAFGEIGSSVTGSQICVAYVDPGGSSFRRSGSTAATAVHESGSCAEFKTVSGSDPYVQVGLARTTFFIGVVYNKNDVALRSNAIARHEHE